MRELGTEIRLCLASNAVLPATGGRLVRPDVTGGELVLEQICKQDSERIEGDKREKQTEEGT